MARLRADATETTPTDIVNAVLATGSTQPTDITARLDAMKDFQRVKTMQLFRAYSNA